MYEITLHGAPPAGLTLRFPSLTLYSVPAVTVLSRRVRYLRWAARFEPERTVIRVLNTGEQLQLILDELADCGTGIDHLIRRQAA